MTLMLHPLTALVALWREGSDRTGNLFAYRAPAAGVFAQRRR
jgi:hypothetical protein